jgi:hypothetical protein
MIKANQILAWSRVKLGKMLRIGETLVVGQMSTYSFVAPYCKILVFRVFWFAKL